MILRNLTYKSDIYINIGIEYINNDTKEKMIENFKKINIGSIPIMIHSKLCILNGLDGIKLSEMGECPYDIGGYFIIGGMEKVIVSHERKAENKVYIIKSKIKEGESSSAYLYGAQIKSVPQIGSVKHIVPLHLPSTIFGKNLFLIESVA